MSDSKRRIFEEEQEQEQEIQAARSRLAQAEAKIREARIAREHAPPSAPSKEIDAEALGGLWAFWGYDSYPYLIGGKVVKGYASGVVKVEGYGDHTFKPKMLILGKDGEALRDKLKALTTERDDMLKGVEETFRKKLDALLAAKG